MSRTSPAEIKSRKYLYSFITILNKNQPSLPTPQTSSAPLFARNREEAALPLQVLEHIQRLWLKQLLAALVEDCLLLDAGQEGEQISNVLVKVADQVAERVGNR